MDNFNILVAGGSQDEDLVSDGWTDIIRNLGARRKRDPRRQARSPEADRAVAGAGRLQEDEPDPRAGGRHRRGRGDGRGAEALVPPVLQAADLQRRLSADLQPAERHAGRHQAARASSGSTETGLVVDGVEYEVDCIIFATGFEVGTAYTRRAGYEIYGRGGRSLTEYWANGPRTLHGFYSHGFPNCFHIGINQNALTPNFPHMLDEQARHIADIIQRREPRQAQVIEPTAEAEADWVQTLRDTPNPGEKFYSECTPGYYNGEGKPGHGGFFSGLYGAGPVAFYDLVRAWRSSGGMPGLQFG